MFHASFPYCNTPQYPVGQSEATIVCFYPLRWHKLYRTIEHAGLSYMYFFFYFVRRVPTQGIVLSGWAYSYAVGFCSPLKRYLSVRYLSVRSHELLPRTRWKLVFLASEWVGVSSQDLSRAVSRFSRGPVAGNRGQHFFDPTGSNTITIVKSYLYLRPEKVVIIFDPVGLKSVDGDFLFFSTRSEIVNVFDPVGSKKCWRWHPATGPPEKCETALDRSWRKLQVILRRGRPISKIFGANAHRTYWNVLFQRTANPTA